MLRCSKNVEKIGASLSQGAGVCRVLREAIHPQQVSLSPDNDLFIATKPRKKVTTLYQTDI